MAESSVEIHVEPGAGEPGSRVLRATVRNGSGWGVQGATVTFTIDGDGTFAPGVRLVTTSALTDERGFAWARWWAVRPEPQDFTVTATTDTPGARIDLDHFRRRVDVGPYQHIGA